MYNSNTSSFHRQDNAQNQSSLSTFEVRQAGQFDDHGSTVWRVSWNMTGTILASSGDDGCVRLWKGIVFSLYLTFVVYLTQIYYFPANQNIIFCEYIVTDVFR